MNSELSVHPIHSKDTNKIKVQKRSKDIIKIIHVTSVVQPLFYEAPRIYFVHKENNFIQQFVSYASPIAPFWRVSTERKQCCSVSYVVYTLILMKTMFPRGAAYVVYVQWILSKTAPR